MNTKTILIAGTVLVATIIVVFALGGTDLLSQTAMSAGSGADDACAGITNMMKSMMCKMMGTGSTSNSTDVAGSTSSTSQAAGKQDDTSGMSGMTDMMSKMMDDVDPANPPVFVSHNFIDLDRIKRISKLRSGFGHDYSAGSEEYDATRQSCRSMKHYLAPKGVQDSFGGAEDHSSSWATIRYFAPVDGELGEFRPGEVDGEYAFELESSEYPSIKFRFHHVRLVEGLYEGSVVTAGQHIGHIAMEEAYGELGIVHRKFGMPGTVEFSETYLSVFQVMTDELFAQYQARGVASRDQMIITRAARDASPVPCDNSEAGYFLAGPNGISGAEWHRWQWSETNWVILR